MVHFLNIILLFAVISLSILYYFNRKIVKSLEKHINTINQDLAITKQNHYESFNAKCVLEKENKSLRKRLIALQLKSTEGLFELLPGFIYDSENNIVTIDIKATLDYANYNSEKKQVDLIIKDIRGDQYRIIKHIKNESPN